MIWRLGCHKKVWLLVLVLVRKHVHWFFDFTNAARKTQAQTNDTLTKGARPCDSTNVYIGQHALPDASAKTHATISWQDMWTQNKHTSAGPTARDIWSPSARLKPIRRRQRGPPPQPTCVIPVSERIGMRSLWSASDATNFKHPPSTMPIGTVPLHGPNAAPCKCWWELGDLLL